MVLKQALGLFSRKFSSVMVVMPQVTYMQHDNPRSACGNYLIEIKFIISKVSYEVSGNTDLYISDIRKHAILIFK